MNTVEIVVYLIVLTLASAVTIQTYRLKQKKNKH